MSADLSKIAGLYSSLSISRRRHITEKIVYAGLLNEYGQEYKGVFRSRIYRSIGVTKRIYMGLW